MRKSALLLFVLLVAAGGSSDLPRQDEITISGRVLDAESRILLGNVRVDIIDPATGDSLARDVRTDSLGRFATSITVTGTEDPVRESREVELVSIYPSPAPSGEVNIAFRAPATYRDPAVEVYDATGRRVVGEVRASGVYFARLVFADGTATNSRSFVKLPGESVEFGVQRTVREAARMAAGKSAGAASNAAIQLVYSHPAYLTLTQNHDTGAELTDLTAAIAPVLLTVEADSSVYDVTYAEDAVVIGGAARGALVEADTVRHVYTFDSAMLAAEGITLAAGDPMIVEGLALRRITNVQQVGDHTVAETGFASLTEVIADGDIAWRHEVKLDADALAQATVAGKRGSFDPEGLKLMFKYKEGDYDFAVQFELNPADTVRTAVTLQVTKKLSDSTTAASFVARGRLKDFESSGDIAISNSEAEEIAISNDNVRLEMELSLAAAGSGLGDFSWDMPEVALPIRFTVGYIPVTLNVKVQVVLKMVVQNEASATATTTMSYGGNSGFRYDGDINVDHQTINHLFHGTNADSGANIGNFVDAQFGIAFPKIDVEIFAVPIVPNFLVGFVVGTSLTWGPVCKSGYTRIDVKAGADFKIFDLELPLLDELLWQERRESAPC